MTDHAPTLDRQRLQAAYAAGELSVTGLVQDLLPRLARSDAKAVWISRVAEAALRERAAALDALDPAVRAGLPLFGLPFAVKDNIDVAGLPTTAACPAFAYAPERSAPAVQRLLDAGAILVGKTNLDQFATGLVGVRSPYGVPENPFDARYIPGGSSSGSAVAVAAGLVSFALGTDTAGSGRVPAGFNNIVGLKPTRGRIAATGVVPACRSLDCVSIFALTAADAAAVLDVAGGPDAGDSFSRPAAARPLADWATLRLGVPRPDQLRFFGDAKAEGLFGEAVARAEGLGARLVEIDFQPFAEAAALLYQGPWVAERLAAIEGFMAGHAEALWPETRSITEGGARWSAVETFKALYRLEDLRRRTEPVWTGIDAMLLPTSGTIYTLDQIRADPIRLNTNLGYYTNFVNFLDLAGIAVPNGFANGLPYGVTLLAPAWTDRGLARLAQGWQRSTGLTLGATGASLPDGPDLGAEAGEIRLAVVGAHLRGQPLNRELTSLGAAFVKETRTAATYRLYALDGTTPAKPGLARSAGGGAIEVEVWALTPESFGRFVAAVPPPLVIGTVELADGSWVKGFLAEPHALADARDITDLGGWRAYRRTLVA